MKRKFQLKLFHAQSALKALVNDWLGIPIVPAMAYVYVEDITYWRYVRK